MTGRIHSFESFGTVDGPGIRFVVFMQGCPLRCIYCHNRDTWDIRGGVSYTVDDVMAELDKYKSYFRFSGGGITVSGGEPLLQTEFVTELFKSCRSQGIHTALDTSGFTGTASREAVDALLQETDLVLLDIKHPCDPGHRQITGVDREKPATFARLLSDRAIPVWIRYVLIPGYTDSTHDLEAAAAFIKSLSNIENVEVLPYHSMGAYKWKELDCPYPLEGVMPPDDETVKKALRVLRIK
ncbi:MAG: pyruvate formate lyase-activating protein [Clostridiaceae bacterium]|jgi:pyruvate formate lyase activating enzyme|nr:pyruvate formate lyase-activating protein [Clostridiaceae bacterium]